ncbi:MAG: hypothetical protein JXA99_10230 [Candidatus Lokiarchaeota archaeon]|nr:hypothetical protein [Candidatus Lokiarchaeota archaeon]
MVSEIFFYLILTALIIISIVFILFVIYVLKMMPHPLMMKVLSTLHATLFGYETALIELIGPRGYKSHVFPKIIETIKQLKGENELIDAVVNASTPKEAMEKWIDVLTLTRIAKDAHLVEINEDHFVINIPHCSMCDPIHEIMGLDAKGICPMAMIIAAASSFVYNDKNPVIDYSKINPLGTSTVLKFEKQEQ